MLYVLIGFFSYWFADISTIPQTISKFLMNRGIYFDTITTSQGIFKTPTRLKPLDCEKCLAFWIAIGYSFTEKHYELIPLYVGCSSLVAYVTFLIIAKIKSR